MEIKWKQEKKNQFNPEEGEIFLNNQTQEIMLMGQPYFSGGRKYYKYTTFKGATSKGKMMLQHEFLNLRATNSIVKIKISNINLSQVI